MNVLNDKSSKRNANENETRKPEKKTNQNANETQFQISYQNVTPNGIELNQNAVRN